MAVLLICALCAGMIAITVRPAISAAIVAAFVGIVPLVGVAAFASAVVSTALSTAVVSSTASVVVVWWLLLLQVGDLLHPGLELGGHVGLGGIGQIGLAFNRCCCGGFSHFHVCEELFDRCIAVVVISKVFADRATGCA